MYGRHKQDLQMTQTDVNTDFDLYKEQQGQSEATSLNSSNSQHT